MGKKRILLLAPGLPYGGAEKALINLINALDPHKYEVLLLTADLRNTSCKEIKRTVNYSSISQPFNLLFGKKSTMRTISFVRCFESFFVNMAFNQVECDVIFLFRDTYDLIKFLLNKKGSSVSILRIASDYRTHGLAEWVHTQIHIHLKMHTDCYSKIDHIIAGSQQAADSFVSVTGLTKKAIAINNIVDEFGIKNSAIDVIDINKTRFTIGTVGRLFPLKGHMRLLEACHKLNCEGYEFDLWLIGSGSEEQILMSKAKEHGMNNVFISGYQDNPYKYMRHFDLFVNPSLSEGFPNASCEAVILGIPCVVTDHCGAKEIFGNSEYGLVTENTDEGLYEGIKQVLSNEDLYNHFKAAVVRRQSFFDRERSLEKYERLFEKNTFEEHVTS